VAGDRARAADTRRRRAFDEIKSSGEDLTRDELEALEKNRSLEGLKAVAGTNSIVRIFSYRPEGFETQQNETHLLGLELLLEEQGALDKAVRMREENELNHPGLARIKFLYATYEPRAHPESKELKDTSGKRALDYALDTGAPPLVVGMPHYLTAQEIVEAATASIKGLVESKVKEQKSSDAALEMIVDDGWRREITALQKEVYERYSSGDKKRAEKAFQTVVQLSKDQGERLGDLIELIMVVYENTDVERFAKIEQLENFSEDAKQLVVGGWRPEEQVKALLTETAWMNSGFSASMAELDTMFICKKGGVEDAGGEWTRSGKGSKVAMRIAGFKLDEKDEKKVVRMSMGCGQSAGEDEGGPREERVHRAEGSEQGHVRL